MPSRHCRSPPTSKVDPSYARENPLAMGAVRQMRQLRSDWKIREVPGICLMAFDTDGLSSFDGAVRPIATRLRLAWPGQGIASFRRQGTAARPVRPSESACKSDDRRGAGRLRSGYRAKRGLRRTSGTTSSAGIGASPALVAGRTGGCSPLGCWPTGRSPACRGSRPINAIVTASCLKSSVCLIDIIGLFERGI